MNTKVYKNNIVKDFWIALVWKSTDRLCSVNPDIEKENILYSKSKSVFMCHGRLVGFCTNAIQTSFKVQKQAFQSYKSKLGPMIIIESKTNYLES